MKIIWARLLHVGGGKAFFLDSAQFFIQCDRIDHQTVADDAGHFRTENTGRNQVQNVTFVTDFNRVSGVVAALKAYYHIHVPGEDVDQFTFTLITPLGTDQNIYRHSKTPCYPYY